MISLATETERPCSSISSRWTSAPSAGSRPDSTSTPCRGRCTTTPRRKLILKGVDGVVFVADSQIERMEANIESMQNLYDNMAQHGYDLTKIPFIIQYNKRDLPNAAPIEELQAALNPGWPVEDPAKQKTVADPDRTGRIPGGAAGRNLDRAGAVFRGDGGPGRRRVRYPKAVSKLGPQDVGVIGGRRCGPCPNTPDDRPHRHHAADRLPAIHRRLLAQAHRLRGLRRGRRHGRDRRAIWPGTGTW